MDCGVDDIAIEDIVASTRIRLARNIKDRKFPNWCNDDELADIFNFLSATVTDAAKSLHKPCKLKTYRISDLGSPDYIEALCSSNFISKELLDRPPEGSGFVSDTKFNFSSDFFSVMINEEDHLRIQYFTGTYDLHKAWEKADELDNEISKRVDYAFNRKLGYLTACPSNLGTGMRASVMLAIPGLVIMNEFESTCRAIDRLGFNVRGCNGEGTSTLSCLIQISNRGTLGMSEQQVLADLTEIVDEVIYQERKARLYAMRKTPERLNDFVARGIAIVQNARIINSEDAANALYAVAFGILLGMVSGFSIEKCQKATFDSKHSSIRMLMAKDFSTAEIDNPDMRDAYRARLLRAATKNAKFIPWPDSRWE